MFGDVGGALGDLERILGWSLGGVGRILHGLWGILGDLGG